MEPPVANCFREISEFDDAARNDSATESNKGEDVNESLVHSTINISAVQACRQMNIKDTFVFVFLFSFLLDWLH